VARAWRSARRDSGDASDEIEVADVPRGASERSERVSMAQRDRPAPTRISRSDARREPTIEFSTEQDAL
jgi:hypothetical protein